ncbi:MAG: 3-isopropylmalate dehydratase small subunit [Deferribacteraceae bacterium]|nr:3-isopropylmalate dehydratase small subunit [Deferribacteraceae bacterium]
MNPIKEVRGTVVPLIIDDIDTDRIIPARYLRCVTFDGIGEFAFHDERFDEAGKPKDYPLNEARYKGATIILSANNFGCGSSREHAPQSIKRAGFNAVIAESFAEIFFGNSLTIGLPCVTMAKADIRELAKAVETKPSMEIEIALENMTVTADGRTYKIAMPDVARKAMIDGSYDLLAELIRNKAKADDVNSRLPY